MNYELKLLLFFKMVSDQLELLAEGSISTSCNYVITPCDE